MVFFNVFLQITKGENVMETLFIKINHKDIEQFLEDACNTKGTYIYNTVSANEEAYIDICQKINNTDAHTQTLFVVHRNNIPFKVYLCKSQPLISNYNIMCKDIIRINELEVTVGFFNEIGLSLKSDFEPNVYVCHKSISESNFRSFLRKVFPPFKIDTLNENAQRDKYSTFKYEQESTLHQLAQKSSYCIRAIGTQSISSDRNEFQRDRERIIHTKAYRRLVDKAQIFTSTKGDHYRTRMTHTLEVSSIARGIATSLKLNTDLTEAIALGHDIGHTPFGHQGERTINAILNGEIDIIPNAYSLSIGGFKHNYQSLRILSFLEEKYLEHEGIDLSYQTLEGILKHTKFKIQFDINQFLINGDTKYLRLTQSFPSTLEGQIVSIADEIAQRGHDLDDSFASGLLTMHSFEDLCQYSGMEDIKASVGLVKKQIKEYIDKGRVVIDDTDIIRAALVPKIIGYLMNDVIIESSRRMEDYLSKYIYYFDLNKRVDHQLICFSEKGRIILEYLEKIISRNVINSFEVSRFDSKAELIIKGLFTSYFQNPRLLPDNVLKRFNKEVRRMSMNLIDLRIDDPKNVSREIENISIITDEQLKSTEMADTYRNKRGILARCIADHISGMTDNYALSEYSRLFEI